MDGYFLQALVHWGSSMPSVRIENVVLVALIVFVPRAEAFPDGPQTTSPAVKALQGLRDEGFRSRVDFRKVGLGYGITEALL